MPDSRTDLEIRILTTAELQGIKLTEAGLQSVKEKTQELAHKTSETTTEFQGYTDAQKAQAQALLKNIDASKKAADTAEHLGKNVNSVKTAFSGLRDVIGGALNGNLLQIGSGFGKISSAVTNAGPAMQTFFGSLATGAAKALPIIGAVSILMQKWKMDAADAEAAMKRWWDEAAASAEAYKQRSAEVKAAAEADLAAQLAAVQRLADAYDSVLSQMDKAEKRADAITAAQKEKALAEASTPEERAAIEKQFGALAADTEVARADIHEKNAREAQSEGGQENRNAEAAVREAESRFKGAPTRANREAVDLARANLDKVQAKNSELFSKSQDQIDDARTTREVGAIRNSTRPAAAAAAPRAATGAPLDTARAAELRRTATTAQASGDFAAQDAAVAELKKMNIAAKSFAKAAGDNAKSTATSLDKATNKLKLAQQSAPGGG